MDFVGHSPPGSLRAPRRAGYVFVVGRVRRGVHAGVKDTDYDQAPFASAKASFVAT